MRTGCAEGTPLCEKFLPDSNNFQLVMLSSVIFHPPQAD